jgi:glycosyltransferase involved in cell wall biosynthesis
MLAFSFAPELSGGTHRPLAFAKYLPEFGMTPIVLTRELPETATVDPSMLMDLSSPVPVFRAGLGPSKEYLRLLTRHLRPVERMLRKPSHWIADGVGWRLRTWHPRFDYEGRLVTGFVQRGQELVDRFRPELIWASGPPHEMLKAGALLARRNRIPLIADFRDPWTYGHEWAPKSRLHAWMEHWWELRVVRTADRVVFTSPLTQREVARRHPMAARKFSTITNGFDTDEAPAAARVQSDRLTIRFLGTLCRYRTPRPVIDAVGLVKERWPTMADQLSIQFIGPVVEDAPAAFAGTAPPLIEARPAVPIRESRRLMVEADVLLLLQTIRGRGKDVISGKLYEYLSAGRPILGVVAPGGGDEWLLRETWHTAIADFQEPAAIAEALHVLWRQWRSGVLPSPARLPSLERYHRRALTADLHRLMESVLSARRLARSRSRAPSAAGTR